MAETGQYYQALKLRKVDSVLIKIPGAYHGIASKASWMFSKIEHSLRWFENIKNRFIATIIKPVFCRLFYFIANTKVIKITLYTIITNIRLITLAFTSV